MKYAAGQELPAAIYYNYTIAYIWQNARESSTGRDFYKREEALLLLAEKSDKILKIKIYYL